MEDYRIIWGNDHPVYYFAYGSNMNPDRMTARGVTWDSFEYGELKHYRLRSNKISKNYRNLAFANIEPCFEDNVFGVLYKLRPDTNLFDLDKKEGYPAHYEKTFVPIHTADGIKLSLVYTATRLWTSENDSMMSEEYRKLMADGINKCEGLLPLNDHVLLEQFLQYKDKIWEKLQS